MKKTLPEDEESDVEDITISCDIKEAEDYF